jgi:hypothetical protein
MKRMLLATTAAVALIAGMSLAAAQGTKEGAPGAAGATQGQTQKQGATEKGTHTGQAQPGAKGAGEKNERMGQKPGEKNEHTGQKTEEKNERMGQKPGEKNERTGQKTEEKNERMGQKPGEKNERTGQQPGEKNERTGQQPGEKNERMGQKPGEKNERMGQQPGEKNERTGATTTEHGGGAKSVQLSSEQRTRIHEVIGRNSSARVDHVDFSLSVGTRVPRTVHVVVLPEDIVRIVPEYRGFKYIIVRDEIVILDPETLEIVAIIPA